MVENLDLVTASSGTFNVWVNDELIFSKKTIQKRHAEPGEILEMFRDIVGADVPTYPGK